MVSDVEVEEVGSLTEEDLLASVSPEPLPEVYITVQQYMEENGCCHATALKELHQLVKDRILLERKTRAQGRERWIFY